jgi:membrane protein required for colicin V production
MIPLIDVILLIILAGFVFYGLFFGLIRTFGAFAGVIVGAYLASRFYLPAFDWVNELFFRFPNLGKVLMFIILFTLINRAVGFGFYLLDKAFNIISIIPFLKTINRLGGAVLGFVTGALILGLILYVASRYAFIDNWFGQWLVGSKIVPFLTRFSDLLLPLLPEMLKKLKSLI